MAKKTSGAVTFRALASPKQSFSIGTEHYRFTDGFFTTDNEAIITFLRSNPSAEEVKPLKQAAATDEEKQENGDEGQPN